MAKFYAPQNWYWIVGGDQTRAFSSAVGDYVPAADPTFVAWKSDGTLPTVIDTEASLGQVLSQYLLRPTLSTILDGYTTSQAVGVVAKVDFKIMFNHENRIRAIERALGLNGSPPNLTPAQAMNAVKALM